MPLVNANTQRFDPYKNYKFRIKWKGRDVAGFTEASGLACSAEIIHSREGNNSTIIRKSPGQRKYEPITLKRGVINDPDFQAWASGIVASSERTGEVGHKDIRRDLILEIFNEASEAVLVCRIHRCWVSKMASPSCNANANSVAIELITLENEGWESEPNAYGSPTSP